MYIYIYIYIYTNFEALIDVKRMYIYISKLVYIYIQRSRNEIGH